MKTLFFSIVFFLPFGLQSQSVFNPDYYPISTKGENYIAREHADSAYDFATALLQNKNLSVVDKAQANFIAGRASFVLGDPDHAIPFFLKAKTLAEKNRIEPVLLHALLGLSAVYGDEQRNLDSAEYFLTQTKVIGEKLRDTISLANYYIYYANIFYLKEQYESAISFNYICETLLKNTSGFYFEKAKNYVSKGNNQMELFIASEEKELLRNAQESYSQAISIYQKLGRKIEEAHVRNSIAGSYQYSANLPGAEKEVQESIKLGEFLKDTSILINGYYTLATIAEMTANAQKAIYSLQKLKFYLDKKGSKYQLQFMEEQFGNTDINISLALINSKIGILSRQIENQKLKIKNWTLLIGSLFLLVISIAIFSLFRQRNKLHRRKLENLLQAQELEYMKAREEGEKDGRHKIVRQIHDGLGGFLVSAKWNLESALEELPEKETRVAARLNENLRLQEHSYRELRKVVYALEKEESSWWEDLQKYYKQVVANETVKVQFYTYNLDKNVQGYIGKEARFIVQEIITNALKHSKATEINVQINQIKDVLGIIVEDNGIGFDPGKTVRGMGFTSIEERCAKLGGSVSFESEKGHGVTVFVDLPVNHKNILKENPLLYAGTN